jgi:hypothetical protein
MVHNLWFMKYQFIFMLFNLSMVSFIEHKISILFVYQLVHNEIDIFK